MPTQTLRRVEVEEGDIPWRPGLVPDGGVCTGESYKQVVKLTFFRGASIKDPKKLFNSSLEGSTRRAIDFREGEKINETAFKQLIRARWRPTPRPTLNGGARRSNGLQGNDVRTASTTRRRPGQILTG